MTKLIFIIVIYALPFVFISVEMLNRKRVGRTICLINLANVLVGFALASLWVVSESDGFSQMFGVMYNFLACVLLSIFSVIYFQLKKTNSVQNDH